MYEQAGLKGLDLAFYRKRSRYHTKYDSVAALNGRSSLWAMMSTALEASNGLIKMGDGGSGDGDVVYFDCEADC